MWTKNDWVELRLQLNERAVVFREGEPVRALGPGKHRIDRKLEELKPIFDTDIPLFEARPEVRAVLPAEWFREVTVGAHERAVLFREGRPVQALKPGIHRHWTVDPTVHVEVFPVAQPPPNDARVLNLLKDEVVQVLIGQHQRGLLFVEGRLARVLEPGRHLAWNTPESPATVSTVDMRHQTLNIQGQELMTQDKVSLRLSVIAEWSPKDPALVQRVAADPGAAIYTLVQLALREFVAGVTLDELLSGRDALTRFLEARVVPEAEPLGARVHRVGLKDILLPGEMKVLFNRVIEAEKQAQVDAIRRREDAAHLRNQANAAQLMLERPAMLRLKELEALEKIAGRIGELKVVLGQAGLEKLLGGG
jgi:regulator of protease activity HflC (stomatin/prohibitin superfamily)